MKKAMESNQGNLELKMKYLELCQETWEPHQISKEIEDMLFVQPTNLSLWQHYLLFHQSRLSSFSVTRMSKMYQKCLKTLLKHSTGKVHTAVSTGDVPQKMLVILGQYLNFLKQTGLTERAIATFQALVEFNLFCPIKYKEESLENRKALFESFWDSNVPRVGEEVAKGWSFYAENKVVAPTKKMEDEGKIYKNLKEIDTSSLSDEQKIIDEKLSKQQTWLKIEQLRSLNHWLPWRPDISKDETEEDCEDVDRLVLFDDISPFLIDIPESLCFDLMYAFLQTIGAGEERSLTSDLMSQCYVEDLSSLSQNMQVLLSLNNFSQNSSVVESFVTAVCQQTGKVLNSEHKTNLALLMLNYKADKVIQSVNQTSAAIKSIKSLFKSVLKEPENRENVDIWMRYAQLLWKCGQNQEAIGILEMAISLLGPKKGQDVIQMYRVLVELLLGFTEVERLCSMGRKDQRNDVNPSKALSVLSCLVEGKHQNVKKYESVSPIAILKCGKTLETLTNASWLKIQEEIGEDGNLCLRRYLECVKCKALFEYINTSSKIDTATSVLNQALVEMYKFADSHSVSISDLDTCNASDKVTGTVSKLLYDIFKYKVRLVQHHMNLSSYPLQNLRSVIDAALELFPNDSCFLQAFLDCEKGSHFLGRVDRYFSRSLSRVTSLVPVVYAVMSQLERMMVDDTQVPNTGALNRVRAYLERGLESKEIQHCPLLWRLYLQLEAKFNQLKNAQGVFYRAVQHCPWSKAIYMDAVSLLKEDKMEEILDLMTEKELRMQILLEEIDILSS
ncbi:hypothetical protein FSP39_004529 [Pinctada imbricata]|uniref:Uncharacterized protein n=1 Tax=Pinctada imbricata TaxID=66713 RepID=A0AA88XVG1_PINIB|nr:hypothetical protein FSP39_004529 [Pinctada imbricata]